MLFRAPKLIATCTSLTKPRHYSPWIVSPHIIDVAWIASTILSSRSCRWKPIIMRCNCLDLKLESASLHYVVCNSIALLLVCKSLVSEDMMCASSWNNIGKVEITYITWTTMKHTNNNNLSIVNTIIYWLTTRIVGIYQQWRWLYKDWLQYRCITRWKTELIALLDIVCSHELCATSPPILCSYAYKSY